MSFCKASKELIRQNRIWLQFCLITATGVWVSWYVLYLDWIQTNILTHYAVFVAELCGRLLQFIVPGVQVLETIVGQPQGFAMVIDVKCTGIFQISFLTVAIAASPASAVRKLNGAISGVILLFGINLFRLLSIFLVGCYALPYVDVLHDVIWEALMIALTFFIWFKWKNLCAPGIGVSQRQVNINN